MFIKLSKQPILYEWIHQPVQRHLRIAVWNPSHLSWFLWRIPLLSLLLSKLHLEEQLLLRYLLYLRELNHCEFNIHHNLRNARKRNELPMVFLPQRQRLHVLVYLHHFLLRNPMLLELPSSRPIGCKRRKPGLCKLVRSQPLLRERLG